MADVIEQTLTIVMCLKVRESSKAFLTYIKGPASSLDTIKPFSDALLQIFQDYSQNSRFIIPVLKSLDLLLSNGIFDIYSTEEK